MLFSVLIPVYNAEEYITETVQSVLKQSEQDFEIVLLDDGSKDNSREICRQLCNKDASKIRFYYQKNSGVLFARRKLAELSKGDYLLFVDSDDLLEKNALSVIRDTIKESNADLVIYDLMKLSDKGNERYTLDFENGSVFKNESKQQILRQSFLTKCIYSMCQKAIRRDCFDFEANYDDVKNMRIAEDIYQSMPIMDKAETIAYIKEPLYIYRKNHGGATSSVKLNDIKWDYKLYDRQNEYIKKWKISDEDIQTISENRMRRILGFLSVYAKQNNDSSYKQFKEYARSIKNNKYYMEAKEKASINNLQKIYKLDIVLLKMHCYHILFQLHKRV